MSAHTAVVPSDTIMETPSDSHSERALHDLRALLNRPGLHPAIMARSADEWSAYVQHGGGVDAAERHAREAVRMAPDDPQAHDDLGAILEERRRPVAAEFHHRRALDLMHPERDPEVVTRLALSLVGQGRMQEARGLYQEVLEASPNCLRALLGLARLEEADRDLAAALALLDRAEAVCADHPSIPIMRATVLGRMGDHEGAVAILEGVTSDEPIVRATVQMEKGRALDRIRRHGEAFGAFVAGQEAFRGVRDYTVTADNVQAITGHLRAFFTTGRVNSLPRATFRSDIPQPVFIMGHYRSGTTLMEQTLSAHPRIAAGDELPVIHDMAASLPRLLNSPLAYPEALSELWMAEHRDGLDDLRDHYARAVAALGVPQAARWHTDKMPLNETHMGLIALMFPHSPLVHMVRHPLDTMLSVSANLCECGFGCAGDLVAEARHYALVMDLVDHYRSAMNLRYLRVHYEDLVDDHEATVRRVLDFIGESFDERCLRFHENPRYARTCSYAQVTEPIYTRSKFRHRNYMEQLAPTVPILRRIIERLGYEV